MTTTTGTVINTIEELCALPEFTIVLDADGTVGEKHNDGKPTTNPNWIYWASQGVKLHSNEIALPATVTSIPVFA